MTTLLAGDIGGTKTILRLVQSDPVVNATVIPTQITLYEATFPSREFADLVPLVQQFFAMAVQERGAMPTPDRACFGIAGPVVNNTSELTNLNWSLRADRLCQMLDIPKVSLINDFAAVGYGVLGLTVDDVHTLQAGEPDLAAPIAIIGAGTGLGQGFLVPHADGYHTYPSEGGHADFAPRSELEFHLLQYLRDRHQVDRISAERVVSGMGIVSIYQFLRDRETFQESPEMTQIYREWQREMGQDHKTVDLAAEISKAALRSDDFLCQKTMELFVSAYGAEAGNLALKLLPYGGLYVAGGVAAKNLPLMSDGRFMQAFLQKGRVSPVLKKVPVRIVLNPRVGLIGAALYAAQLA